MVRERHPAPPPEDRRLSPYTGWTRGHWESVVDRTLAAVRPYASPRHALVELPEAAVALLEVTVGPGGAVRVCWPDGAVDALSLESPHRLRLDRRGSVGGGAR